MRIPCGLGTFPYAGPTNLLPLRRREFAATLWRTYANPAGIVAATCVPEKFPCQILCTQGMALARSGQAIAFGLSPCLFTIAIRASMPCFGGLSEVGIRNCPATGR